MTTYEGPATLLLGDQERTVHALLVKHLDGALWVWKGTLYDMAEPDAWALFESDGASLRLPDGRVGQLRLSDDNHGRLSPVIGVSGVGEPPF